MIHRNDIIRFAELNGLSWEESFPQSRIAGEKTFDSYEIGLELTPNAWFWWGALSYNDESDLENLFFIQRYNRNTGGIIKAFSTGYKAEIKISDYLNSIKESEEYDLVYNGVKVNRKPLTDEQANEEISSIIMNYGYKPEKVRVQNNNVESKNLEIMKKSFKEGIENAKKYKEFVGVALWTVFRCWKVDQWAYNLKNEKGETLWGNVKEGKSFSHIGEDFSAHCVAGETFVVLFEAKVKFEDGVQVVKGSSIKKAYVAPKIEEVVIEPVIEEIKQEEPVVSQVGLLAGCGVGETKKEKIIRLLKSGKEFKEIAAEAEADISYVRKLSKKI